MTSYRRVLYGYALLPQIPEPSKGETQMQAALPHVSGTYTVVEYAAQIRRLRGRKHLQRRGHGRPSALVDKSSN